MTAKRKIRPPAEPQKEELPPALAAFGEQFMAMFDDYDEQQARDKQQQQQAEKAAAAAQPPNDSSDESQEGSSSESEDDDEPAAAAAGGSKQPGHSRQQPASQLDAFLSRKKGSAAAAGGGPAPALTAAQSRAQQQQQEQQRLLERKLRKQFMSSKVAKIFDDVAIDQPPGRQQDDDGGLTAEEFAAMRRDVELLGASALDKRAAKAWKAAMLARLGAAADKAPRTPARIGLGMAKKAKQRQTAALQEAIAAGMVKAKGRGKKIRAEKAKQRDRGLQEAGPGFKNGVLRLPKKARLG